MAQEGADIVGIRMTHPLGVDVCEEASGPSQVAALRPRSVVAQLQQALHLRKRFGVPNQASVTFTGHRCILAYTELAEVQTDGLPGLLGLPIRPPRIGSQFLQEDPKRILPLLTGARAPKPQEAFDPSRIMWDTLLPRQPSFAEPLHEGVELRVPILFHRVVFALLSDCHQMVPGETATE